MPDYTKRAMTHLSKIALKMRHSIPPELPNRKKQSSLDPAKAKATNASQIRHYFLTRESRPDWTPHLILNLKDPAMMTPDSILQIAQLSTMVFGGLGVFVALRSHQRQIHAQIFIEFSSRFHNIIRGMPSQVWSGAGPVGVSIPPPSDELTRTGMQCFHLMADLFLLHKGGYISNELWKPWQRGIKRVMQGPLMQREWAAVQLAFNHYPDFCHYVHGLISDHGRPTDHRRKANSTLSQTTQGVPV